MSSGNLGQNGVDVESEQFRSASASGANAPAYGSDRSAFYREPGCLAPASAQACAPGAQLPRSLRLQGLPILDSPRGSRDGTPRGTDCTGGGHGELVSSPRTSGDGLPATLHPFATAGNLAVGAVASPLARRAVKSAMHRLATQASDDRAKEVVTSSRAGREATASAASATAAGASASAAPSHQGRPQNSTNNRTPATGLRNAPDASPHTTTGDGSAPEEPAAYEGLSACGRNATAGAAGSTIDSAAAAAAADVASADAYHEMAAVPVRATALPASEQQQQHGANPSRPAPVIRHLSPGRHRLMPRLPYDDRPASALSRYSNTRASGGSGGSGGSAATDSKSQPSDCGNCLEELTPAASISGSARTVSRQQSGACAADAESTLCPSAAAISPAATAVTLSALGAASGTTTTSTSVPITISSATYDTLITAISSPTPTASKPASTPSVATPAPAPTVSAAPAPAPAAASAASSASTPMACSNPGGFVDRPVPADGVLFVWPLTPKGMLQGRERWTIKDYEVTRPLHAGYASSVYKATCLRTKTDVVLKAYNLMGLSTFLRHQVLRELDIHSRLQHATVVQLLAAFKEGDMLVLVQEYVRGGSLDRVRRKLGGRMTEFQAMHLVLLPLLNALVYLHGRGIVHRDIKPENLLFTPEWQFKVCDFGVSICLHEERAVTKTGSKEYMAPEVVVCPLKRGPDDNKDNEGLAYTPAVDVWSLGALIYELLVGFTPFPGGPPARRPGTAPAMQLSFPSSVSEQARSLVRECLQVKPMDRPTVQQLLQHPWVQRALAVPASRKLEEGI